MQSLRKIPFLLAVMISLLLAGCWDLKEINEIGFTVGLGIDKDGDDYQITTQIALPALLEGSGGGEEPPVWVVSGKGRTIFEAIRDVNTRSARKPLGAFKCYCPWRGSCREGLIPVLDLLSRGQELRRSNYVVLAQGKARDIWRLSQN